MRVLTTSCQAAAHGQLESMYKPILFKNKRGKGVIYGDTRMSYIMEK
jgi:hypothetical protein